MCNSDSSKGFGQVYDIRYLDPEIWVYYNKIPIYPSFYLLKDDCKLYGFLGVEDL